MSFFQEYEFSLAVGAERLLEVPGYAYEVLSHGRDPWLSRIYRLRTRNSQNEVIDESTPWDPAAVEGIQVGRFDKLLVKASAAGGGTWRIRIYTRPAVGYVDAERVPRVGRRLLGYTTADITYNSGITTAPINLATIADGAANMSGLAALDANAAWPMDQVREEECILDGAIYGSVDFAILIYHAHNYFPTTRKFKHYATIRAYDPSAQCGDEGSTPGGAFGSDLSSEAYAEGHVVDFGQGVNQGGPLPTTAGGGGTPVRFPYRTPIVLPPGQIRMLLAWNYGSDNLTWSACFGLRTR